VSVEVFSSSAVRYRDEPVLVLLTILKGGFVQALVAVEELDCKFKRYFSGREKKCRL